jgi:hypothetical protein
MTTDTLESQSAIADRYNAQFEAEWSSRRVPIESPYDGVAVSRWEHALGYQEPPKKIC